MNLNRKNCINKIPNFIIVTWLIFVSSQLFAINTYISHFVDREQYGSKILIPAGENKNVTEGMMFNAYRKGVGSYKFKTGEVKVIQVFPRYSIAEVIKQEYIPYSVSKYNQVMALDLLEEKDFQIEKNRVIVPNICMYYEDLFKAENNFSAELSDEGKYLISKNINYIASKNISKIIIEAFSDSSTEQGQSFLSDQVDSEEKVSLVKDYVVNELDINKNKIVAIGMGNSSPKVDRQNSKSSTYNNRIEIKVLY